MADIARILIVGGGIAGLTLATALQQRGFRPELIERSPTWDHIANGAGIADAAHASSPLMGQGGCMAIEDPWVLAEVLQSADTVENALSTYVSRPR